MLWRSSSLRALVWTVPWWGVPNWAWFLVASPLLFLSTPPDERGEMKCFEWPAEPPLPW